MPKICYVEKRFKTASLAIIDQANEIIDEYQADGLTLTLRQLYYQFISKALLPNNDKSYDNLGSLISDARLAGLIDWEAIEDRARNLETFPQWKDTQSIIDVVAEQFALDRWKGQDEYVEVWVEKQALESVIAQACEPFQVPYLACKGYMSQSEMWRASMRFRKLGMPIGRPRRCTIIHLGDHDPSGIDMTRDIQDRLNDVFRADVRVERIALTMEQVEEYEPPPNPAKLSDARARDYVDKYGDESWELDALNPRTLRDLIQGTIREHLDEELFDEMVEQEEREKKHLQACSDNWTEVTEFLRQFEDDDPPPAKPPTNKPAKKPDGKKRTRR